VAGRDRRGAVLHARPRPADRAPAAGPPGARRAAHPAEGECRPQVQPAADGPAELLHQRRRRRRVPPARAGAGLEPRDLGAGRRVALAEPGLCRRRVGRGGRLRRRPGAVARHAARLQRAPAAAGVRGAAAALPVLLGHRPGAAAGAHREQRVRDRAAVRARRAGARIAGRREQPRAVLHAGDQPVPEAARPHPARPGQLRAPCGAGPHAADGLRGPHDRERDRLRHRPGRRAALPAAVCHLPRRVAQPRRVLHAAARAAAAVEPAAPRRPALGLHRPGGVPVAGRPAQRAVPRRHPPGLADRAGHQPRPADAAARLGQHLGARRRRAGRPHRDDARPVAAGAAHRARRRRLVAGEPVDAELPEHRRRRPAPRGLGAAQPDGAARAGAGRQLGQAGRGHPGGGRARGRAPPALPRAADLRLRRRGDDHRRRARLPGLERLPLGCVLEHFYARHASANSFSETIVRSATRGEILRSQPRIGSKAML